MISLSGRVALVTGASRGLGPVIARRLATSGADVVISYRESKSLAEDVATEIRSLGRNAEAVRADLSVDDQAISLIEETERRLGRLDILVHNVGPGAYTPFLTLPSNQWHYVMNANCTALYLMAQTVAASMRERGWGRVIAIGAASARIRSDSVYGLAKDTMRHLVQSLAVEMAPSITVNVISPGLIADNEDMSVDYAAVQVSETPMGRLVTRAEVADAVAFLCDESARYITGEDLVMDGGRTIPRFGLKG